MHRRIRASTRLFLCLADSRRPCIICQVVSFFFCQWFYQPEQKFRFKILKWVRLNMCEMCRCTKEWRPRLNCTSWSLVLTSVCVFVPCDRLPQGSWRVPSPPLPTSRPSLYRPPLLTLPRHTTSRLVLSFYWIFKLKSKDSVCPPVYKSVYNREHLVRPCLKPHSRFFFMGWIHHLQPWIDI